MLAALLVLWAPAAARAEAVRGVVGRDREHVVAAGENLYTIAQDYGLAIEHLAFANGLRTDSVAVAPGTKLLVPGRRVLPANPPADGLVINLPERLVYLFRGGQFEKFYPIAIGQPGRFATPQGSFTLVSRVENPAWLPPSWAGLGEITVPAGPDNPLGDRWMGLSLPGVGLHATTSPMSIGQAVSHGCMRMYPASARELFEKVWVGMPARIEYETVKVGYEEETGNFYVAAFPDVYWQDPPAAAAARAVEGLGLEGILDADEVQRLAVPTGVARVLLGSDVTVAVGNQPLDLPLRPLILGGTLWVPTDVPRALGLAVSWDATARTVEVRRGEVALAFTVGARALEPPASAALPAPEPEPTVEPTPPDTPAAPRLPATPAGPAYLLNGRALVPIRPLLQTFGLPHRWDAAHRTLYIEG